MNLIHLSDLHFSTNILSLPVKAAIPDGGLWAKEWRKTQVRNLALQLTQGNTGKCDGLFFTGDLVTRNERKDVVEAINILTQIANACGAPSRRRFACIGNHDFGGRLPAEARAARRNVIQALRNNGWQTMPATDEPWRVERLGGAALLMLESREWESGRSSPRIRPISSREIADILRAIGDVTRRTNSRAIIVMSHDVPRFTLKGGTVSIPTDASRAWPQAGVLFKSIVENLDVTNLLWLCGDAHCSNMAPEIGSGRGRVSAAGPMNVTESMLVSSIVDGQQVFAMRDAPKYWPSARLVDFNSKSAEIDVHDYVYQPTEGDFGVYCAKGDWVPTTSLIPRADDLVGVALKQQQALRAEINQRPPQRPKSVTKTQTPRPRPPATAKPNVEVISDNLLLDIDSAVRRQGLFDISWTSTHSQEETLSWVPMSELLIRQGLFFNVTIAFAQWLKRRIPVSPDTKLLLLGLDSWGSMLASQIGVMLGIGCIPSFSPNMTSWSDRAEGFSALRAKTSGKTHIALVTDVIATGKTIEAAVSILRRWNPKAKYYVASVLLNSLLTAELIHARLPRNVVFGAGCNTIPLLSGTLLKIPSLKGLCGLQYA